MPGPFGNNTTLGTRLNEMGSKQDGMRVHQVRFKIGTIIAFGTNEIKDNQEEVLVQTTDPARDGLYKFIVRTEDGQTTSFLPLVGKANNHAASTGHPSEFLGSKCFITYQGPSVNRGKILDIVDDFIDPLTVGGHNQLQITGAAFAPPGNGLI